MTWDPPQCEATDCVHHPKHGDPDPDMSDTTCTTYEAELSADDAPGRVLEGGQADPMTLPDPDWDCAKYRYCDRCPKCSEVLAAEAAGQLRLTGTEA